MIYATPDLLLLRRDSAEQITHIMCLRRMDDESPLFGIKVDNVRTTIEQHLSYKNAEISVVMLDGQVEISISVPKAKATPADASELTYARLYLTGKIGNYAYTGQYTGKDAP